MTYHHSIGPETAELYRRYADARARLFNGPQGGVAASPKRLIRIGHVVAPLHEERPQAVIPLGLGAKPVSEISEPRAPLNMLEPPCGQFLITLAALRHGVTRKMILGPSRKRPLSVARHEAVAMIYQHTQQSLPGTGRMIGLDHTTVLYILRKLGKTKKLVDIQDWSDPLAAPHTGPRTAHDPITGHFVPGPGIIPPTQQAQP